MSSRPRYVDHRTTDSLGVLVPADADTADLLHVEGRTLVSPRRMRMRVLAAMVSFRETQPIELWDRFVTKKDGKRAARDLAQLRRRDPSAIAFCHQSPWHVPIRWFVLFRDDERELIEDERGRWRLRYRTTTRRAIRRAEQAIAPLRRSDLGPIGDLILDLHQWMAHFDPASVLELDYADALRLPTVGRARRRPLGAGHPRRPRGPGGRGVPAGGRRVPGRADALGRGAEPRDR